MIPLSLIVAIAAVESNGNPNARGKHGELGVLQISAAVAEDCNRFQDLLHFTHEDALNPERAEAMCRIYLSHYAPKLFGADWQNPFNLARLWHGGPHGWANASTLDYALRVVNLAHAYEANQWVFRTITGDDWAQMFRRDRAGVNLNPLSVQIRERVLQTTSP